MPARMWCIELAELRSGVNLPVELLVAGRRHSLRKLGRGKAVPCLIRVEIANKAAEVRLDLAPCRDVYSAVPREPAGSHTAPTSAS